MNWEDKTIYLCLHCGNKMKGKRMYCDYCKTAEQRREIDRQNQEILKKKA